MQGKPVRSLNDLSPIFIYRKTRTRQAAAPHIAPGAQRPDQVSPDPALSSLAGVVMAQYRSQLSMYRNLLAIISILPVDHSSNC